jgi:hypothetical protein
VRTRTRGSTALLIAMLVVVAAVGAACRPGGGGIIPTAPGGGGLGGGQHRQVSYGPFTIPAARGTTMGMLENTFRLNVAKPCTGCYVTGIKAGLVGMNGQPLNVNTGEWLHHMVLMNSGATDLACAAHGAEWFFASGNERTPVDLTKSGNYGYPVRVTDSWSLIVDLMNMTTSSSNVRVTVDFDYVPMSTPGMRPARPIWIDAGGCPGASEVPVMGRKVFDLPAQWRPLRNAKLLSIHGHTHDGATAMDVSVNGRQVCSSVQHYGESPEYIEGGGGSDHGMPDMPGMPGMPMGMAHISSAAVCQGTYNQPVAQITAGGLVRTVTHYDDSLHPLMKNGGRYENVMGIAHGWVDLN